MTYVVSTDGSKTYALAQNTGMTPTRAYSSTDATLVIQQSIDALTRSGGGRILITKGTYSITEIVVDHPGITIESDSATLIANSTGVSPVEYTLNWILANSIEHQIRDLAPVILVNSTSDIVLRDLVIDGNSASGSFSRDGILIWDSIRVVVEGCEIRNVVGSGIRTLSSGTFDLDHPADSELKTRDITIRECSVHDTRTIVGPPLINGFGYEIEFSDNVTVESSLAKNTQQSMFRPAYSRHVTFTNNTGDTINLVTSGEVFDLYRSDSIVLKGNNVYDPDGDGIYVYEYVTNLLVEENTITSLIPAQSTQIRIQGIEGYQSAPIDNLVFRNNNITGNVLLSNSRLTNLLFEGNTIYSLKASLSGETPQFFQNVSFVDNAFLVQNAEAAVVSIPMDFSGNKFFNTAEIRGASGTVTFENNQFTSDSHSYATGMTIDGSNLHVSVTGNYFQGITYQAIFVNVDTGLQQNGLIEINDNHFEDNGFIGPQNTIVFQANSTNRMIIDGNYFADTPGDFVMSLHNVAGEVTNNTADKPVSWQPS